MNRMPLPERHIAAALNSPDWLHLSVRDFFSSINWENRPLELRAIVQAAGDETEPTALKFTMSVSKFFAGFNWADAEIAAAVAVPEIPLAEASIDLTLDDFSGFF